MEFIFLWKSLCSKNGRAFPRCAYICGTWVSSSLPRTIRLAWSSGLKHVLQCRKPRVRVPQLTSLRFFFFLITHGHLHSFTAKHPNVYCHWYFRAFGRMNFHSWVYLYMSTPTKDKIHFLWIFPYREFRFAAILSRNRPVNIRGGVTQITSGLFVVFSSPARLIGFCANSPISHHCMLRGTCTEISI
jgi:hypothetical protein